MNLKFLVSIFLFLGFMIFNFNIVRTESDRIVMLSSIKSASAQQNELSTSDVLKAIKAFLSSATSDNGIGEVKSFGCASILCKDGNMTCTITPGYSTPGASVYYSIDYGTTSYTEHVQGNISYGGSFNFDYAVTRNCDGSPVPGSTCVNGGSWSSCQPCDECENDYNIF